MFFKYNIIAVIPILCHDFTPILCYNLSVKLNGAEGKTLPYPTNSVTTDTLKRGLKSGIEVTWQLAKVMLPIYFTVTLLKHTPVLDAIARFFAPLMGIFGLPGEAALVLVIGNLVNLYAAIGAIASLSLSLKEISILAIMLSFCHSLPVETALAKKIGLSAVSVIAARMALAVLSGLAFNLLL